MAKAKRKQQRVESIAPTPEQSIAWECREGVMIPTDRFAPATIRVNGRGIRVNRRRPIEDRMQLDDLRQKALEYYRANAERLEVSEMRDSLDPARFSPRGGGVERDGGFEARMMAKATVKRLVDAVNAEGGHMTIVELMGLKCMTATETAIELFGGRTVDYIIDGKSVERQKPRDSRDIAKVLQLFERSLDIIAEKAGC
jgi:hypothetical protein